MWPSFFQDKALKLWAWQKYAVRANIWANFVCVQAFVPCSQACPYILQDVVSEVPAAKQLFQQASDVLGYDLFNICTEGKQGDNMLLQQCPCQLPALHHHLAASRSQGKARLYSSQPASHLCGQSCSFGEAQARRGAGMCTGLLYISQHDALHSSWFHCSIVSPLSHKAFTAYLDCSTVQEALDAADVTGGLSLGEYTALTFAGAMRYCCIRYCRTCMDASQQDAMLPSQSCVLC